MVVVIAIFAVSFLGNSSNLSGEATGGIMSQKVRCIFSGSKETQQCLAQNNLGQCKGVGSCEVRVVGVQGKEVHWKSSCGGYATSVIGGTEKENNLYWDCAKKPVNITRPVESSCKDPDGENYYLRSKVEIPNSRPLDDSCATFNDNRWRIGDLLEYVCRPYGWSSGTSGCSNPTGCADIVPYKCPYGCEGGACLRGTTTVKETCIDSDGLDLGRPGSISGRTSEGGTYVTSDYCTGDTLHEFSCVANRQNENAFDCRQFSRSCVNGACI